MKAGGGALVSSALFGFVVATIYWFTSHHSGGTILLGLFGTGLSFLAINSYVLMRDARLSGDDKDLEPQQVAGEYLGSFTTQTMWPLVAAVAVFILILGAITLSPGIAAIGFIALLLVLRQFGRESNREKPRKPDRS